MEWNQLVKYLDPNADTVCSCWQSNVAGGALKSTAAQQTPGGWNSPNAGATNSSGFSAGPGGIRGNIGNFYDVGYYGYWWSSSLSGTLAWARSLYYSHGIINRGANYRGDGFSVRCLRDIVPSVSTTTVSNVTATSATTGGDVTQDGGAPVTMRGVVYGTSSSPTTLGTITNDGAGTGVFTSTLTGLTPSTNYYVRAYGTNSVGTAYGNEVSFTTSPLSIGMSYAGGIIFYLDSTGRHGLVCAPSDQGLFQWGCRGTNIIGTMYGNGTGQANTNLILSGCTVRPIAASVCDNLILNGYSDWYLPSGSDLDLMYSNLRLNNLGNFQSSNGTIPGYWSSTQQLGPEYAKSLLFWNGGGSTEGKENFLYVRAVRPF
jgi:hypothetical protein